MPAVPLEPLRDRDPRRLGAFRLLGRLGAGGMGVAFLAEGNGQWAVVKMIRSELADDRSFRARLSRELDAMGRARGTHTASLLDADVEADPPWFAMEFIPGVTLARRVDDGGALPMTEVVALAVALVDVLRSVHGAGIVHRDLKPSNIMLSPTGPKLIDFGIADLAGGTQLTKTGVVLGSTGWLAPEQVRGDPVTAATDIHAWALSVLFAATGTPPFGADTSTAALYKVLEASPEVPDTVPAPLRDLLVAALAKEPTYRPTLERLLAELTLGAPPAAPGEPTVPVGGLPPEPLRSSAHGPGIGGAGVSRENHRSRTKRRAWIIGALLAVALVGGLLVGAQVLMSQDTAAPVVSPAASAASTLAPAPATSADPAPVTQSTPTPSTIATETSALCSEGGACRVGDTGPGGGIVFMIPQTEGNLTGLSFEAAPAGWASVDEDPVLPWCSDVETSVPFARSRKIGAGAANTAAMVATCQSGAAVTAVQYSGGGMSDWFLPSLDELSAMRRHQNLVEGFRQDKYSVYWSSSEEKSNSFNAWTQTFVNGAQDNEPKSYGYFVRPVRSFTSSDLAPSLAESTPAPPSATPVAPVTPAATTTLIRLYVNECEGCEVGVQRAIEYGNPNNIRPSKPAYWEDGPLAVVRNGFAAFEVPTKYTPGMTFTISAPWEVDAASVTNIVLGSQEPVGSTVGSADGERTRKATACWAGTSLAEVTMNIEVSRVIGAGYTDSSISSRAWVSPTVATIGRLQSASDGRLGNQEAYYC